MTDRVSGAAYQPRPWAERVDDASFRECYEELHAVLCMAIDGAQRCAGFDPFLLDYMELIAREMQP